MIRSKLSECASQDGTKEAVQVLIPFEEPQATADSVENRAG